MTARERAVEVVTDALIDQATVTADHVLKCLLANPNLVLDLLVEQGVLRQGDIVWQVTGGPNLRIFHECLPQGDATDA